MKIVTIIGARPQFIKAAVISRIIKNYPNIYEVIIHTGQHYDDNMSNVFFQEMNIPQPHYNLTIGGMGHGAMTGKMLIRIEEIIIKEEPDWVFVYGDTNSTLAGALAASKLNIKIAHIEAGLRSYNMQMPEEINRLLTDQISTILFCPTETAVKNLDKEGFSNRMCQIFNIGDVMQDAALYYAKQTKNSLYEAPSRFILCTIHRAENTNNSYRLLNIMTALEELSKEISVILPLHPRTRRALEVIGYSFTNSLISFRTPVGYLEMIYLLKECQMVMTDSGGLQKEAYFFEKFCITLRDETEWVELIEKGYNILVGANKNEIVSGYQHYRTRLGQPFIKGLYGNGNAGKAIIDIIQSYRNKD